MSESWWLNVSREDLTRRALAEAPRMNAAKAPQHPARRTLGTTPNRHRPTNRARIEDDDAEEKRR